MIKDKDDSDTNEEPDSLAQAVNNLRLGGSTDSTRLAALRSNLETAKRRIEQDLLPALRHLKIPDPELLAALENAVAQLNRHLRTFTLEYKYKQREDPAQQK
jgi:hypothetical protein